MPNIKIIPFPNRPSPPPISESALESQRLMASLRSLLWAMFIQGIAALLLTAAWMVWRLLRCSLIHT